MVFDAMLRWCDQRFVNSTASASVKVSVFNDSIGLLRNPAFFPELVRLTVAYPFWNALVKQM